MKIESLTSSDNQKGNARNFVALVGPYYWHNFGDDLIGSIMAIAIYANGSQIINHGLSQKSITWLRGESVKSNWTSIIESKRVVIGGGGILGDAGLVPTLRYYKLVAKACLLARLLGKKCVITGVGAGPVAHQSAIFLLKISAMLVDRIGVREESSFKFLVDRLGVSPRKVVRGADIALVWEKYICIEAESTNLVGVQFAPENVPSAAANSQMEPIKKLLANFVDAQNENGILLSNSGQVPSLKGYVSKKRKIYHYAFLPDFLKIVKSLKVVVTSHLHLAIAAYAARIPCFSIYINIKTKRFYDQIGHPDRAIPLDCATADDVSELLRKAEGAVWTKDDEALLLSLQEEAELLVDLARC